MVAFCVVFQTNGRNLVGESTAVHPCSRAASTTTSRTAGRVLYPCDGRDGHLPSAELEVKPVPD